jgi:hypothetical protein
MGTQSGLQTHIAVEGLSRFQAMQDSVMTVGVRDWLRRLNRTGIVYYLTGSMAGNYWGISSKHP